MLHRRENWFHVCVTTSSAKLAQVSKCGLDTFIRTPA